MRAAATATAAAAGPAVPSSPLQQCLAAAGVADWAAYASLLPPSQAPADEAAAAEFAAKVSELWREGLTADGVLRLFLQPASPRRASLDGTFRPNLAYLRGLLAGVEFARAPYEPPALTPLGRLLRHHPRDGAYLLSRSPSAAWRLDEWARGEMRVPRPALAAAALEQPRILFLPVDNARAVAGFLGGELGLSQPQAVELLLREPGVFEYRPEVGAGVACSQSRGVRSPFAGAGPDGVRLGWAWDWDWD